MVLPSQSGRPQSRHSHMYRQGGSFGRRGRRKPLFVFVVAVLVVSVGVWGLRAILSSGPAPATGMEVHDEIATAAPVTEPPAPVRAVEPPTIRMGETTSSHVAQPRASEPVQEKPPVRTPAIEREPTPPAPAPASAEVQRALDRVQAGMDLVKANRPVEARRLLTQALDSETLNRREAERVRQTLREINDLLIFSPTVVSGDPFVFGYTVVSGDTLGRLTSRENLNVDWRLIQRINRIARPENIRVGQNLKLVRGPFHVVVYKRDFRLDVYLGEGDDRVFVRSFNVGLGEYDSTPVGTFRVRPNSKLINPEWVNPRTGQRFLPDDPTNPIGERWIGLEGVSENIRDLGGYGIHGTIEPASIGTQSSMGCIRMLPDDVELLYEMLAEGKSIVVVKE